MRRTGRQDRDMSVPSVRLSIRLHIYRSYSSCPVNVTRNGYRYYQDFLQIYNKGPYVVLLIDKYNNAGLLIIYASSPFTAVNLQ